ncbi:MAG: transposase [Streptosporangiaceae bacterium]
MGDCRSRFPDPWSPAALAGTAPVARRSGCHTAHTFRWAVNHQLRDAVCDFAAEPWHASPWAAPEHGRVPGPRFRLPFTD